MADHRSTDRRTTRLVKIRVVDESITEQVVSEPESREVQHFLDGMTPQWVQTHSQKSFSCIVVSWKDTPYLRPSVRLHEQLKSGQVESRKRERGVGRRMKMQEVAVAATNAELHSFTDNEDSCFSSLLSYKIENQILH